MSSFSRSQHDKIVVGTNDVSQPEGQPDKSPTGTAILNGPVYVGTPSASPNYDAVFNVGTPPPPDITNASAVLPSPRITILPSHSIAKSA